jgi:lipopolysaccharide/colanic/teichoic acid biosynthesis glycosyltransferase
MILPGITGLAQVQGARGITDDVEKMAKRLQYDLLYMKQTSPWHDAQICWQTVKTMFRGDPNAW